MSKSTQNMSFWRWLFSVNLPARTQKDKTNITQKYTTHRLSYITQKPGLEKTQKPLTLHIQL